MIRRDYILRMLAEFVEVLSRIRALQKSKQFNQADELTKKQFEQIVGLDPASVLRLSETELMAKLIQSETTLAVREKALILGTLLKEAGDSATAQGHEELGHEYYLKGLHMLLGTLAREDVQACPDFVPSVEVFVSALADRAMPITTEAMLMQHYERLGEFAKAEDCFFRMLDEQPDNIELIEFGLAFYQRLQGRSDEELVRGNLPRNELESGMAELRDCKQAKAPSDNS